MIAECPWELVSTVRARATNVTAFDQMYVSYTCNQYTVFVIIHSQFPLKLMCFNAR